MDEFLRQTIQEVCADVAMTEEEKVSLLLKVLTAFLQENSEKDGHIGS